MDDDRVKGAVKQVKGSIKEAIGKITGDATTEAEGTAEKLTGKTQAKVGEVKDSARGSLKD